MTATGPLEVTELNFEGEVLKSTIPAMVDFWAEWCGPCRMIAPVVEEIAQQYSGRVKVCKVNVDENQALASRYGIRSIPSLLIFKDGVVTSQVTGAAAKSELVKKLDAVLKG